MIVALVCITCFLAYANGANDNFKGVASLFGSGTTPYRTAIWWATLTTFAGSIFSWFFAQILLKKFSGKGLVPDHIVSSENFLLSVALAAGITVIIATVTGFPVSTTHALLGAILGSGLVAAAHTINLRALTKGFVLSLVLSPVLAVFLTALLYFMLSFIRLRAGVMKDSFARAGETPQLLQMGPIQLLTSRSVLKVSTGVGLEDLTGFQERRTQHCSRTWVGIQPQQAVDIGHFASAGMVSFARGLNDTPKIVAILLAAKPLNIQLGVLVVAVMIAAGGLTNAKKVARTMSERITAMNHGQGFAANLATAVLVIAASIFGLPVSTTHVSVGALFGIRLITRQGLGNEIPAILLSWVLTVPCAIIIGAASYWVTAHI